MLAIRIALPLTLLSLCLGSKPTNEGDAYVVTCNVPFSESMSNVENSLYITEILPFSIFSTSLYEECIKAVPDIAWHIKESLMYDGLFGNSELEISEECKYEVIRILTAAAFWHCAATKSIKCHDGEELISADEWRQELIIKNEPMLNFLSKGRMPRFLIPEISPDAKDILDKVFQKYNPKYFEMEDGIYWLHTGSIDISHNMTRLSLDNLKLTKSLSFVELESVKELSIRNTEIKNARFNKSNLKGLKKLVLNNSEHLLPLLSIEFTNLKELELVRMPVSKIDFSKYKNLTKLKLDDNAIVYEAPSLSGLDNLTELIIVYTRIKNDDFSRYDFKSLTKLELSYNSLTEIKSLMRFDSLEELIIVDNKIGNVNFSTSMLRNLKILKLINTGLTEYAAPAMFERLEELDLSDNHLVNIDFTKCSTGFLKKLRLANIGLTEIPPLPNFRVLQELDLSRNKINFINLNKNAAKNMPSTLKTLNLDYNPITNIKVSESGARILFELERLYLSETKMRRFPWDIVKNLKNLRELGLSN